MIPVPDCIDAQVIQGLNSLGKLRIRQPLGVQVHANAKIWRQLGSCQETGIVRYGFGIFIWSPMCKISLSMLFASLIAWTVVLNLRAIAPKVSPGATM